MPVLDTITRSFSLQNCQRLSNSSSLSSLLSISPQTIVEPISYTLDNLAPLDEVPLYVSNLYTLKRFANLHLSQSVCSDICRANLPNNYRILYGRTSPFLFELFNK